MKIGESTVIDERAYIENAAFDSIVDAIFKLTRTDAPDTREKVKVILREVYAAGGTRAAHIQAE